MFVGKPRLVETRLWRCESQIWSQSYLFFTLWLQLRASVLGFERVSVASFTPTSFGVKILEIWPRLPGDQISS